MATDIQEAVSALKGTAGWFVHITPPEDWHGLIDQMRWDLPCAIVVCALVASKRLEIGLSDAIDAIGSHAEIVDKKGFVEPRHEAVGLGAELMLAWLDKLQ